MNSRERQQSIHQLATEILAALDAGLSVEDVVTAVQRGVEMRKHTSDQGGRYGRELRIFYTSTAVLLDGVRDRITELGKAARRRSYR